MIIGVCGFIGSGKDTVAKILIEKHGFQKMSFADSLKDAVASIFDWPRELLEGDTHESRHFREEVDIDWSIRLGIPITPRKMLQKVGTEAIRDNIHQNIWAESAMKKMEANPGVSYVISDTRFKNEIATIQKHSGHVICVTRGNDPEWYEDAERHNRGDGPFMTEKWKGVHQSEWDWIGTRFDYVLSNDGPLSELEANVNYMLTLFRGPVKI